MKKPKDIKARTSKDELSDATLDKVAGGTGAPATATADSPEEAKG